MKYFIFLILSVALFLSGCNFNRNQELETSPITKDSAIAPRTGINDSLYKIGYTIDTIHIVSLDEFEGTFLYDKNCKMCHGNDGIGDGVVARHNPEICPFDLTKLDENYSDQKIYYVIINGKNKMPGHGGDMSEKEVWVLIIHVKEL